MSANVRHLFMHHGIEPLESRIAPAAIFPTVKDAELAYDANPATDNHFVTTKVGTPILVTAGQVLTTGVRARDGVYMLFVEQGSAIIFTTDFNNNNQVDFNEITGIAAGNGLRLISFVDINGDIVTNLDADGTLSDSNNNATGDDPFLRGDGKVLDKSRIEKIELRSLTSADITDQDPGNDAIDGGSVDDTDVAQRLAFSSYSIHGNVFAGGGIGLANDPASGIIINSSGANLQSQVFTGVGSSNFYLDFIPSIGAVKVGTAASGEYFSFSVSKSDDIQGNLRPFVPASGQAGADIVNIQASDSKTVFSVSQLVAGDGGPGAAGGSIINVHLNADINGGYFVKAGDGGRGPTGGAGGSIVNFSDIGSVTSVVTLQSGNGGEGTTGTGGAGGVVILAGVVTTVDPVTGISTTTVPFNVNGGVSFLLGNGGDGFRAGGAGASLGKGIITAPATPASFGRNIIGMTHDGPHDPLTGKLISEGTIGRTQIVDFDQDGFGDFVFSTSDSEQLVVQFGDGTGGYRLRPDGTPDRIYLDAPIDAEAITVGDFNGDGHQDIAAASQNPGNFGGLFVYLSSWEDANVNGLTADEDVNHNGVNELKGFLTPRQSALPALQSGDPDGGVFFNANFAYLNSGHAISDIEAGDFNGDGYTDIAISVVYVTKFPVPQDVHQLVLFMNADVEDGRPTGKFYADFGDKRVAQPPQGANPFLPFFDYGSSGVGQIEATALSTSATHDVILAMPQANALAVGGLSAQTIVNGMYVIDNSVPAITGPAFINFINSAGVDTNRLLPGNNNPNIAFTPVFFREFAVLDFNLDGNADFAALSEQPVSFIVAWTGDGIGGATEFTTNNGGTQNAGLFLGIGPGGSYGLGSNFRGIRVVDADGDGNFGELGILGYNAPAAPVWDVNLLGFQATPSGIPVLQPGGNLFGLGGFSGFTFGPDNKIVAYDPFIPSAATPNVVNFLVSLPNSAVDNPVIHQIESSGLYSIFPVTTPLSERFFHFHAGDGGSSLIGRGGAGGSLGGGVLTATLDTTTGIPQLAVNSQLKVTLPANIEYSGDVDFLSGTGGDGFTRGGTGGNIQGILVRFAGNSLHSDITLEAGNGGLGVASAGGKGGSVIGVSAENGIAVTAGIGGPGRIGGDGGDILGNGIANLYDTRALFFQGTAGLGGNGVRKGGNGGIVSGIKSGFDLVVPGGVAGQYILEAGDGGTAVSGPGGSGGSIVNITPLDQDNFFGGDILLKAGVGGNGTAGGAGGNVSTFINGPDGDELPKVLSILAGQGGNGTSGPGGAGGSVSNIIAPMKGVLHSDPAYGPPATVYGFNRILAGNGGSSAASAGGNGGSVSTINSKSEGGPYAVVAGAGGPGLIRGGDGGNASNLMIDVGGTSIAKLLVVAGNGGDAGAFIANPGDSTFSNQAFKAFGGRVGRGGNGGNIIGVVQSGGIQSHADLVAGNGGDTVFFGGVADSLSFVGRGGSVRNISAAGTLGNILPSVSITSYFDYRVGGSMTDFVTKNLRDEVVAGDILDNTGNVGVVVGAAGRLKRIFAGNTQSHVPDYTSTPAARGINGDLSDVRARGIMAAVAGNVDRIAAIQNVKNVVVVSGFEVGTLKDGDPSYRDRLGNPLDEPVIDGTLVDGAIISARHPVNSAGQPVTLPGKPFVIS